MTRNLMQEIAQLLAGIGEESAFEEVALVEEDGLVICSWGRGRQLDLLNLISLQLKQPIGELRRDSSGVDLDEVLATARKGVKYCFRFFTVDDVDYVLAAVFLRNRPYRRATNNAIKELGVLLS